MSKYKVKNSIWFALSEGIKIYFGNIDKFFTYMLFPVFGQLIGIILAFWLSLGLADTVATKVESPAKALAIILLLAVPGLLIFAKAFWDYMVAYVALNSMTEGAITSGRVYDFQSHNEVATRRSLKFIIFICVVGILSSIGTSIFFIIPGFVLWIYFILVFQIFTFEPDLAIQDYFKRSFFLVKGHWFRTFMIMATLVFFTIFIITQGVTVIFDYLNLTDPMCSMFNIISNQVPLELCNRVLLHLNMEVITPAMISKRLFESLIMMLVMGLTLPVRSICWTIWYYNLTELCEVPTKAKRSKKQQED